MEQGPESFVVPDWFGPEVSERAEFENSALALNGPPKLGEVQVSNRALESLLDTFDGLHSHQGQSVVSAQPTLGAPKNGAEKDTDPKPSERATTLKPVAVSHDNVRTLDGGIARLARSLAPRASHSTGLPSAAPYGLLFSRPAPPRGVVSQNSSCN